VELLLGDSLIHYEIVNPNAQNPVIILHGWGHSGRMWLPIAQLLPESSRIYLVDLPGFGHSSLGESIRGVHDYTNVVLDFIRKFGLTNVVLIGHSFGAQIAVLVASQSVCINKLILVAPALKRQRGNVSSFGYAMLAMLAKIKRILPKSFIYHLSSGLNYSEATSRMKEVFRNSIRIDVLGILPKIKIITLVVWGERDREVLGTAKKIVSLIPHSRLKVIYDAGHNLHLENRNELSTILERYLI
jgi:pimeloyl-ACP methyl ester carboxylesterase